MTFYVPRKKMMELLSLPLFCGILYLLTFNIDAVILFIFGFIWNWSASNELSEILQNKRYKMSMLRLVVGLQKIILKPFLKTPLLVQSAISVIPAGAFWALVIIMNESIMPWWATFLGSLAFEIIRFEYKSLGIFKGQST